MSEPDADQELLELLARGLAADDPIPARTSESARAVFTWRTIDAELLEIGFDSAVDELTGVRGAGATVRAIRFAAGDVEVEVDIEDDHIDGQVLGSEPTSIRLERPDGSAVSTLGDDLGRFEFDGVGQGPVRFRVESGAESHVTQWFVV